MEKDGKEKEKNIMKMMKYYLKVNIKMEKDMGKEKNIMKVVKYYLKVNIQMENKVEKEQNIMKMTYYVLKAHIQREKDGMVKVWNLMLMETWNLKVNI